MGPDGVVRSYGKVNLANQTAYSNNNNSSSSSSSSNSSKSKVIKRSNTGIPPQLVGTGHASAVGSGGHQQHQQNLIAASCAAFNGSGSGLEGGLPSGPRWDIEKTSMAAVPRDFQAGPESLPIKTNASLLAAAAVSSQVAVSSNNNNNSYQPSATMYRNPSVVGKRDAMLSGGCGVYSNSSNNNNNNNLRNNNNNTELGLTGSGGGGGSLWDSTAALLEKSPMATIPRDYQAGPEHMACSKMSAGVGSMLASSGHSLMRSGAGGNGSSYHHHHLHHHQSSASEKAALFAGKFRQHQRPTHRLHPYMMTSSMGGSFPPLMAPAFPQMQQVSCYNV